jgi:hypothetical protein
MRSNTLTGFPGQTTWSWPFSPSDLTAGLRRYRADTSIALANVRPRALPDRRPSIGRLRAITVSCISSQGPLDFELIVKEPLGTTRTGLAGAGRREVGVYHSLARHLPLALPSLVAAAPSGDWLILELIHQVRRPEQWSADDYRQAVTGLAELHERFWDLGEDLQVFPWLSQPLQADFDVHVAAAAKAIDRVRDQGEPRPLAEAPRRMALLASLISQAERVAAPLRRQPNTLLHGDYWPGNIAIAAEGNQIVFDWQQCAVGPGVVDLLTFMNLSSWWFGPLPLTLESMVALYRQEMKERLGVEWDADGWALLWDHALMWRFLQEWIDLLAASPSPLLEARAETLDQVWLNPVAEAAGRRLESA